MTRHSRALVLVVAASAALSLSSACQKSSGGHTATQSPTPTPATPANVVATAGNHRVHVAWSPVTNATGYRVYVSTQAIISTSGITPVFVAATTYDITPVPNWTPQHVRVAADEGALQGLLSLEAQAMPNAGYVISNHVAGATHSLDWFHGDESDVMSDSIANGEIVPTTMVTGSSMLYGLVTATNQVYTEIGLAFGSSHLPLAGLSPHRYKLLGFGANRVALFDENPGVAKPYSVVSFALDGTDRRTLVSNCASEPFPGVFSPNGLVVQCDATQYYSDGVHTGVALPEALTTVPEFITPSRILFYDGNSNRALAQTFDGSAPADILTTGTYPGTTVVLAVGATKFLITRTSTTSMHDLLLCNLDATGCSASGLASANPYTIDSTAGVSADGHAFAVNNVSLAIVVHDDGSSNTPVSGTIPMGDQIGGTQFLGDGNVLNHVVHQGSLTSSLWDVVSPATGTAVNFGSSANGLFKGSVPGYVLLIDTPTNTLESYFYGLGATGNPVNLSTSSTNNILVEPDGAVIWREVAGATRLSNADMSIAPRVIDAKPSLGLFAAGRDPDGRAYFSTERTATDYDTMMVTLTATSAQTIAGAGAPYEKGIYVP